MQLGKRPKHPSLCIISLSLITTPELYTPLVNIHYLIQSLSY